MDDKKSKDKGIVEFRDGEGTMVDLEGNILKDTVEKREQEKAKEAPVERTVISKAQEEEPVEKTMLIDSPFKDKGEPEQVAKLVATFGNDYGKEFPITGKTTLVGRGLDCAIVVNDPSVSRKHFNILKEGDNYKLLDLGSGNGTKVNGERMSEFALVDGTQIEVGTTTFVFTLAADPDKTRAIEIPPDKTRMYHPTASRQVAQIEPSAPPELPSVFGEEAPVSSKAPLIAAAAVAAAIAVILAGHLLLGWRFIPFLARGPSEKEIQEAQLIAEKERKLQEAKGLYEKGVKEFSEKNWDEAVRLFDLVENSNVSIEGLAE
ncbi:MAG: FHA domain-containing protein, partial [Deltaproteobacteria bacterium]|nr:FHA domain-containing protein [Deltaproteobacteria bacterium]